MPTDTMNSFTVKPTVEPELDKTRTSWVALAVTTVPLKMGCKTLRTFLKSPVSITRTMLSTP